MNSKTKDWLWKYRLSAFGIFVIIITPLVFFLSMRLGANGFFWLYSSILQGFVALLALSGVFVVYGIDRLEKKAGLFKRRGEDFVTKDNTRNNKRKEIIERTKSDVNRIKRLFLGMTTAISVIVILSILGMIVTGISGNIDYETHCLFIECFVLNQLLLLLCIIFSFFSLFVISIIALHFFRTLK